MRPEFFDLVYEHKKNIKKMAELCLQIDNAGEVDGQIYHQADLESACLILFHVLGNITCCKAIDDKLPNEIVLQKGYDLGKELRDMAKKYSGYTDLYKESKEDIKNKLT